MKSVVRKLEVVTLLFSVFLIGCVMPANAMVITMHGYVIGSYLFDVDTGQMTSNSSTDVWYHNVDGVVRYLEPQNGAVFANLGVVNFDSVTNLSSYTLSSDPINASNGSMPLNTVLVVKTNMGNYAKMRVDTYPDPINFTIVYQTDGTPTVPELPSMTIIALFLPTLLLVAIVCCRRRKEVD